MRKASRLFEIIQILRLSSRPVTAFALAERLETGVRTVYRDIAALQSLRVPVEGAPGIGYILRPGFQLPPLMFTIEEIEAIELGLKTLHKTGDTALIAAAQTASERIAAAVPEALRTPIGSSALQSWGARASVPAAIPLADVRRAIREERKLVVRYRNEAGETSHRVIRPIALIYYTDWATIVAWCELRQAIRNFRADRVLESQPSAETFKGQGNELRRLWMSGWQERPVIETMPEVSGGQ